MNFKKLAFWTTLFTTAAVPLATAQNPVILQGNYVSNVFGQSNFILNPNAQTNVANVTVSNATVTRSTTTPLVATSEFNITTSTATGYADWATRTFDAGMKNQNCEARFTYRGFSVGSTTVQIRQGSNTVAQLTLTASTDPRIASINFPCGDLSAATTLRVQQATASLTGTNELSGLYLGLATNQANVAQAELVGTWKMAGASACGFSLTTTIYDQFTADNDCNSPTVTGSVVATQGKRPWIDISNPKPGNYYVVAKGSFYNNVGNVNQFARLTAVKSSGNENSSQSRIYGGTSPLLVPITFVMTTTFTSGTLGFVIEALTDNSANPIQLLNDNTRSEIGFEVYRFPTSSELVVTPERQNTWGGVVHETLSQTIRSGQAASGTFYPFDTGWNVTSAFKGKAQAPLSSGCAAGITCSANDLGFSIPNLPVGAYKLQVTGLLNPENTSAANSVVQCNFRIRETTLDSEVAAQSARDQYITNATTRNWINSFQGVFNNTSVGTRSFRIEAAKQTDNTTGNVGVCQAYSSATSGGNLSTKIAFILEPLDQPSNSALYVQGPVKAAATGDVTPIGFQNYIVGTTNSALGIIPSSGGSWRSGTGITLTPGLWEIKVTASIGNVAPTEVRAGITDTPNSAPIADSTGFDTNFYVDDASNTCCVLYARTDGIFRVTTTKTFYPVALAYPGGSNFNYTFAIRARQLD